MLGLKRIFFLIAIFSLNSVDAKEIIVVNTNDNGAGSLRSAIETESVNGDTIIINVKGEIILQSAITVDGKSNLTIIGPYAKHSNLKAAASYSGSALLIIKNSSNIAVDAMSFVGGINNQVNGINLSNNPGPILIKRSLFKDISFIGDGAGINSTNTPLSVEQCSFINNGALNGGAIATFSGNATIVNCTFSANQSAQNGGALFALTTPELILIHNTFQSNLASNLGAVVFANAPTEVRFQSNAITNNGTVSQIQIMGSASFVSLGGNRFDLNFAGETYAWQSGGGDFQSVGIDFKLRSPILEDGYGLYYYTITDASSNLIDIGPVTGIPSKDARNAPRILDEISKIGVAPDAGACEYTPLRVINSSGNSLTTGSLPWALSAPMNVNTVNYVEFDIPGPVLPIEPFVAMSLSGNYFIDGFSQPGSGVPGPDLSAGMGVTAAVLPVHVRDNFGVSTGLNVNAVSTGSTISGVRIGGFSQFGIGLYGGNNAVSGCEIGIIGNSEAPNLGGGIDIGAGPTIIGGKFHHLRNVISSNGQSLGNLSNITINAGVTNVVIQGNIIGLSSNGLTTVAGGTTPAGIHVIGVNTKIGGNKFGLGNLIGNCNIGIFGDGAINLTIEGNKIGTDYSAAAPLNNNISGIKLDGLGSNCVIGGTDSTYRNIVSGNTINNIEINSYSQVIISSNYIGTNKLGTASLFSTQNGILVNQINGTDLTIGGPTLFQGNVISGNITGVSFATVGFNCAIISNLVGLTANGNSNLGNSINGIHLKNTLLNPVAVGKVDQGNVISGQSDVNSSGILIEGTTGHTTEGNVIGLNKSGTAPVSNYNGVFLSGASNNNIGGGSGNIISGNLNVGILIDNGANNNLILSNCIGTDSVGLSPIGNAIAGIHVINATGTQIGQDISSTNTISGSSTVNSSAILMSGAGSGTIVQGNYIGLDKNGVNPIPNYNGIKITGSHGVTIGGINGSRENYISGNDQNGILVQSSNVLIDGNYIGLAFDKMTVQDNMVGVLIESPFVKVGQSNVNYIAGNTQHGIFINGEMADAVEIYKCVIGTNSINLNGIGNGGDGIRVVDSDDAKIGTVSSGNTIIGNSLSGIRLTGTVTGTVIQSNIIADATGNGLTNNVGIHLTGGPSNNQIGISLGASEVNIIGNSLAEGILISDSPNNFVFGNLIGNDGTASSLPNQDGIRIINSDGNQIGNENTFGNGTGNIISGNSSVGLIIDNSINSIVSGNYIGTNITGNGPMPNDTGVVIRNNATDTQIGILSNPFFRNVISANTEVGISIASPDNDVLNNFIGTTADGSGAMGSQVFGVVLYGAATNCKIGGDRLTEGNLISSNDSVGVVVKSGNNFILGNTLGLSSSNSPLGLQPIGVRLETVNSTGNLIGDTPSGGFDFGNVISNHSTAGIEFVTGAHNNSVLSNYIGIDPGDGSSFSQEIGILVSATAGINNSIGTNIVNTGNTISGNVIGIKLDGSTQTLIYNNRIGTNNSGGTVVSNSNTGILVNNSGSNIIGGAGLKSNVISGNAINGVEINGPSSTNNIVAGNVIGANLALSTSAPNQIGVRISGGANNNTIGQAGLGLGNTITGNSTAGILIDASSANNIFNNRIGVIFNNLHGIIIQGGSSNNIIGGVPALRNIISKNDSIGVVINGSSSNQVIGNFIGTSATGNLPLTNVIGIFIGGGASNIIGNSTNGNLISGNNLAGVFIENSSLNLVQNNLIGTDSTGNQTFIGSQNGIGLQLKNSANNTIGGSTALNNGNVIVNSTSSAIICEVSSGNDFYGNKIGINKFGTAYIPNTGAGILMRENSNNNFIGFNAPNFGNSIAANANGIVLRKSINNTIERNFIGNDATGGLSGVLIGTNNQMHGIVIDSASQNNHITHRNILSGNNGYGVLIQGKNTKQNDVKGNHIGVDSIGTVVYANDLGGVCIKDSARYNLIGGANFGDGNVLSGNGIVQVLILGDGTDTNFVKGNLIGLSADQITNINGTNGVKLEGGPKLNEIGGYLPNERNHIVNQSNNGIWIYNADQNRIFNNAIGIRPDGASGAIGDAGVRLEGSDYNYIGGLNLNTDSANVITNCHTGVTITNIFLNSSYGNPIIGNSIYNNTEQGIDINDNDMVQPIDSVQNLWNNGEIDYPIIFNAFSCTPGGDTKIAVEVHAVLTGTYRFDFYSNSNPDLTNGEGETFLGGTWFTPTTNPDTMFFDTGTSLPIGTSITATLTGTLLNTSEFAANFLVENTPPTPVITSTDESCLNGGNSLVDIVSPEAHYYSLDGFATIYYGVDGYSFDSLATGSYTLSVMYLNGCQYDEVITINSGPPLTFNQAIINDTCGFNTGQIQVNSETGSPGPWEYSFDGGGFFSTNPNATNLSAGTYPVSIVDPATNCISNVANITITTLTDVVDESFVFNDFCPNGTAAPSSVATGGGTFSFETAPGDGAGINSASGALTNPVVGNSYSIIHTVGQCAEKDTVFVTALASDDPTFDIQDFCVGSVQNTTIAGLSGGTFSFDPTPTDGASINSTTGEITGAIGGTYGIKYVTNGACPDSLTISINILPQPPAPQIIATDSVYCPNEAISSLSVALSGSETVQWMLNSSSSSIVSTSATYLPSAINYGNNFIYVKLDDGTGCLSLPDSINYYLSDLSSLVAVDDFQTCLGSEVELSAIGGVNYLWTSNTSLSDPTSSSPTAKITSEEIFIVEIENALGCKKLDTVLVTLLPLDDCHVETYNAFSPNGDGTNDFWYIDGIEGYPENIVTIFNRWGDVLIKFENYNNDDVIWDGTNKNGKLVVSGTYFFVVDVRGEQNQTGWVQLIK